MAYFWKIDPASVFALTLERFEQYEMQAERICDEMQASAEQ